MKTATRFTDKTIRTDNQWLKITRDNKNRTFTFSRGYKNEFQAHDVQTLPFKWISNWKEAIEFANRRITTYS
jgi:hypothetical protein